MVLETLGRSYFFYYRYHSSYVNPSDTLDPTCTFRGIGFTNVRWNFFVPWWKWCVSVEVSRWYRRTEAFCRQFRLFWVQIDRFSGR